jgi:CubicO group peptidase (beta-lactamase class C family)
MWFKPTVENTMRFEKAIGFIEAELAAGTFPGAGLLVERKGERLLERYWGTYCSSTQRDVPLDASVNHMLYSFSKGISATAIVVAHQRKLIDYDAPISTYIPEYRGGWKDLITIRKLLTHAAGIPSCPLESVYTSELWEKGVDLCCATPVEWEPGSKTVYHGASAMFLAAAATRRVMGNATWEEICRELVFDPIGAKSLTFRIPEGAPVALTVQPKELPAAIDSISPWSLGQPGAGCFGRMEDMIRVLQLHLNRGVWEGKTLIQEVEFQEMHRIQYEAQIAQAEQAGVPKAHSPWGLGWMIRRNLGLDHWFGLGSVTSPRTFGHAGISTVIGVGEPERQTALAFITTNTPGDSTVRVRQTVTDLVMSDIV